MLNVFENEWNSIAASFARSHCRTETRGPSKSTSAYDASFTTRKPCSCARFTASWKSSGSAEAPVGLFG